MSSQNFREQLKQIPLIGNILLRINRLIFSVRKKLNDKKYKNFDPPNVWLAKLMVDGSEKVIVQIGSNDGKTGDPICDLVRQHTNWKAVFVEPVPYIFNKLKTNYGEDPRFSFENVAINDGSKQIFYSVSETAQKQIPNLPDWFDQLGSFDKKNIVKHLDGILIPYIVETDIHGTTLQTLFQKHQINHLSLLHIDTEGYDWRILSQLDLQSIKPEVILIEHKHLEPAENKSMKQFLSPHYDLVILGGDMLAIRKKHPQLSRLTDLKGVRI